MSYVYRYNPNEYLLSKILAKFVRHVEESVVVAWSFPYMHATPGAQICRENAHALNRIWNTMASARMASEVSSANASGRQSQRFCTSTCMPINLTNYHVAGFLQSKHAKYISTSRNVTFQTNWSAKYFASEQTVAVL